MQIQRAEWSTEQTPSLRKKIKTSTERYNLRDKILLNTCPRLQEGDLIKEYEFFMSSSENKGQKQVIWGESLKKSLHFLRIL